MSVFCCKVHLLKYFTEYLNFLLLQTSQQYGGKYCTFDTFDRIWRIFIIRYFKTNITTAFNQRWKVTKYSGTVPEYNYEVLLLYFFVIVCNFILPLYYTD